MDFALCPPQRCSAPLTCAPVEDLSWQEQPRLQQLYQSTLDWLVGFEGTDSCHLLQGILRCFKPFPLYEHEFRQVAARLAAAARSLIFEEDLHVWQEVGHEEVFRVLDELTSSFRSTVFQDAEVETLASPAPVEEYLSPSSWPAPQQSAVPKDGLEVIVNDSSPGRLAAQCHLSSVEALQQWAQNAWGHFASIELTLPVCPCPTAFAGARLSSYDSGCVESRTLLLLRCAALFHGRGRVVCIRAEERFWDSSLALPFFGLSRFH